MTPLEEYQTRFKPIQGEGWGRPGDMNGEFLRVSTYPGFCGAKIISRFPGYCKFSKQEVITDLKVAINFLKSKSMALFVSLATEMDGDEVINDQIEEWEPLLFDFGFEVYHEAINPNSGNECRLYILRTRDNTYERPLNVSY